jgi:hypothetical protein
MFYQMFQQQSALAAAAAYGTAFNSLMAAQSTSPHRAAVAALQAQTQLAPHAGQPQSSTQEKS